MSIDRMRAATAFVLACAALIAGCGKQAEQAAQPPQPAAALTNPTDFPLYQDAKILDVKPFTQTVSGGSGRASGLASQGAGTYQGHSVIAETSASLDDLKRWLSNEEATPPKGYEHVSKAQYPTAVQMAGKYGVAYGVFQSNGQHKGAVVAVIDPTVTREKLGAILKLLERYNSLPGPLRTRIDEQVKQRTGYSISETLDPSSPLGMTVTALKEVNASGQHAIVLVDATKQ